MSIGTLAGIGATIYVTGKYLLPQLKPKKKYKRKYKKRK